MDREAWWGTRRSPWGPKELDRTEWLTLSLFTLGCLWSLGVQGGPGGAGASGQAEEEEGEGPYSELPSPPASFPSLAWHNTMWTAGERPLWPPQPVVAAGGCYQTQATGFLRAPSVWLLQGSDFPGNSRSSARHVPWRSFYHLYQALGVVVTLVSKLDIGTLVLTHGQNAWKSKPWETSNKKKLRCRE